MNESIENLFGFYYCEIETGIGSYLGIVPVRNKDGIYFPLGKWYGYGWYFSEQLKFAQQNGYNIKVIKGYSFSRTKDVFKNYIEHIYNIKTNPINNTQKSMAKSLLNNLLGRFAIRLEKAVTKLLANSTYDKLKTKHKVISEKAIGNSKTLVTYLPKLDVDLIASLNLDIVKIASKQSDEERQMFNVTSVPISAAITAYGRIDIYKLKMDIMKMGGNIYYSDTYSLVTDIKLPDSMVNTNEIGKLKLEHEIQKGIFISGKTYCFITKNNELINKAKGAKSSSLNYGSYISLLNGEDVTAIRPQSKIDWEVGDVTIDDLSITLNSDSYKKRDKVYKDDKWVNTNPIFINSFDKDFVLIHLDFVLIHLDFVLIDLDFDILKAKDLIRYIATFKYLIVYLLSLKYLIVYTPPIKDLIIIPKDFIIVRLELVILKQKDLILYTKDISLKSLVIYIFKANYLIINSKGYSIPTKLPYTNEYLKIIFSIKIDKNFKSLVLNLFLLSRIPILAVASLLTLEEGDFEQNYFNQDQVVNYEDLYSSDHDNTKDLKEVKSPGSQVKSSDYDVKSLDNEVKLSDYQVKSSDSQYESSSFEDDNLEKKYETKHDFSNKYIGLEDIRSLWDENRKQQ